MAFPTDLSDVAIFKIHPAIGVARLANNEEFYEFFDYEAKRAAGQAQTLQYMSERHGQHWMKRQAVRFRIFAYDSHGRELGELSETTMARLGISASWTANIANRKNNTWNSATPVVAASATATAGETRLLEGNNPWIAGRKVWLGEITGNGVFIPPGGGVYRKSASHTIPPYGSHKRDNGVLDTTSDGSISVTLTGAGAIQVLPACIIVAPQGHSPDVNPEQISPTIPTNKDFVRATRQLLGIPVNATLTGVGYGMDIAMMKTLNADYNPGMEICLKEKTAIPNPETAFFPRGQHGVAANEIRPSYGSGHAKIGQLTVGLCSTWQTDLTACLDWWTSTYPNEVNFGTNPTERFLSRKVFTSAGPRMEDPEDLNAYIDMMEVARDVDGDPLFLHGSERDSGDNAVATPVAPFALEPDDGIA